MRKPGRFGLAVVLVFLLFTAQQSSFVSAAAGPQEMAGGPYRVLNPIKSGNLLLFPVVRERGKSPGETPFITLDEGIRSGEVEVTEAGRVSGLVRPRGPAGVPPFNNRPFRPYPGYPDNYSGGPQVNTLVLVNHSKRPLLLLAGEVVTGGKQDRIVGKDRIVPAGADPINLSVFCIEPGRWTESSPVFGASSRTPSGGFMVQPAIRAQAMATGNQQQVWNSVHGAIAQMQMAVSQETSPASGGGSAGYTRGLDTTSYAKVMQNSAVSKKVDEAAAPIMQSREEVLAQLRREHAVGVVAAVRGEIVWADLFANTDLLSRYWIKLVRSYAAESLTQGETRAAPTVADAQRFLEAPSDGTESSVGEVGVYRYSEVRSEGVATFALQSLLPGTGYDVHISKMKLRNPVHPIIRPNVLLR